MKYIKKRIKDNLPDGVRQLYVRPIHNGEYLMTIHAGKDAGTFRYGGKTFHMEKGMTTIPLKINVKDKDSRIKVRGVINTFCLEAGKTGEIDKANNASKEELKAKNEEKNTLENSGLVNDDTPGYPELIDMAIEAGVIEQNNSWYYVNGESYHGEKKLIAAIKEDKELYELITKRGE